MPFCNNTAWKLRVLKIFAKSFLFLTMGTLRGGHGHVVIDYIDPKGTIQLFDEEVFVIAGIRTDEVRSNMFFPLCDTRESGNCCREPNRDACNNDGNFGGQKVFPMIWSVWFSSDPGDLLASETGSRELTGVKFWTLIIIGTERDDRWICTIILRLIMRV